MCQSEQIAHIVTQCLFILYFYVLFVVKKSQYMTLCQVLVVM